MATKKAVVDIDIKGLNTVQDLENYLEEINDELREMDINSDAFNSLSNSAAEAAGKLKDVNSKLEGVTSTEKAEGVLKMGEGLAGAAIGAQGLTMALGGTNEELNKVVAQVGGLVMAMDGLRRVTEAFSAENIKRLRGVGRSFGTLVKTVKTSARSMRVAMASTGILLLVAAVGMLIANWDKLTNLISSKKREKVLEKEVKLAEKLSDYNQSRISGLEREAQLRRELAGYNDDEVEAAKVQLDLIIKQEAASYMKIKANKEEIELAEIQLKKQIKWNGKFKKGYKDAYLAVQKLKNETSVLIAEQELLEKQVFFVWGQFKAIDEITDNEKRQRDAQIYLTILNGQEFTTKKIYEQNKKLLELQIQRLKLNKNLDGEIKKADQQAIDALEAQKEAMIEQEKLRVRNIQLQIEEIKFAKAYNKEQLKLNNEIELNYLLIDDMSLRYDEVTDSLNNRLRITHKLIEAQDYQTQQQIEMFPFDQKGLEILEKTLGLRSEEVKLLIEFKDNQVDVSKLSLATKLHYHNMLENSRQLLNEELKLNDLKIDEIENNDIILQSQIDILDAIVKNAHAQLVKVDNKRLELLVDASLEKNQERKLSLLVEAEKLEAEIAALADEGYQADQQSLALEREMLINDIEIINLENEKKNLKQDQADNEERITYELKQQVRLTSRMKTFVGEYNKEIFAGMGLISAQGELWATLYERRAEMMQREHDEAMKNINEINGELDNQGDLREEWEKLLKDANAERYDEILDKLSDVYTAEEDLNEQRRMWEEKAADAAYAKAKAERDAAITRKTQSIIDATIQSTLSVIEALPNIVLAAIVGAMGLVGIGTIIAQPSPPKPNRADFVEGGHTGEGGKYEPAGIVHKNEYVIPASIVDSQSGAAMIGTLEAMRMGLKGYVDGGAVSPETQINMDNAFDIDMMVEGIAESLRKNPPVVSVVEITDKQNRVKVIEQNAAI